jgi:hypothetical protein
MIVWECLAGEVPGWASCVVGIALPPEGGELRALARDYPDFVPVDGAAYDRAVHQQVTTGAAVRGSLMAWVNNAEYDVTGRFIDNRAFDRAMATTAAASSGERRRPSAPYLAGRHRGLIRHDQPIDGRAGIARRHE